ncbi:MAG TPA: DUF5668 domain-containing protein [Anaerolineales bacterium]|nr:DUF5668 domain-containing protein [Anaerolineales bacterium]
MTEQQPKQVQPRPERPSLFWPLILVTLGIVFLLRNLGHLEGDAWDTVIKLWPLILVAIGLDGIWQRHGLAGPVLMMGLGAAFLLNNFNLLAVDAWELLVKLWPVLIVAVGLDLVFGRRNAWGTLLSVLITLALLVGTLWYLGSNASLGRVTPQTVRTALEHAASAVLEIDPPVGTLRLSATDEADLLIDGTVQTWGGDAALAEYIVGEDGVGVLRMSSQGDNFLAPSGGQRWHWDLKVTQAIPLDIRIHLASGEMNLDLSNLDLGGLRAEVAVGRLAVILPAEGTFTAYLNGSVGQMAIVAPQGLALRIRSESGLGNLRLPDDYRPKGEFYLSPAYVAGEPCAELVVNQAVGTVTILVP